tara:strand:- start:2329 stop:2754 length:426 start_codon:yes stop_codon:yes gene_type:complete
MSATINLEKWPVALITFHEEKDIKNNIDIFLQKWDILYSYKTPFDMIFDARELSSFSMIDIFKISQFMMRVRKYKPQYCKNTIMVIKNQYIKTLLNTVFSFQKPFTKYYLHMTQIENLNLYDLYNKRDLYPEKFTITLPRK